MRVHAAVPVLCAISLTGCLEDRAEPWYADFDRSNEASANGSSTIGPTGTLVVPPEFGPTTRHHPAPPPLSGGTMAVVPERAMIVAADPDRDQVYVIDLATNGVQTVKLDPGDEPGRVVVDEKLRAHVVLRSGGGLATIDLANDNALTKRAVCTLPRGVAWDRASDVVHVACAGGELVTLPAAGGAPTRTVKVERDLRDVLVTRGGLVVSTFRNGDVIRLADDGSVESQSTSLHDSLRPRVAWRMIESFEKRAKVDPAMTVMLAAQQAQNPSTPPPPAPPAYYGNDPSLGCTGDPTGPVTLLTSGTKALDLPTVVLPIDMALNDTGLLVVVSAGSAHQPNGAQLVVTRISDFGTVCPYTSDVAVPSAEITSVVYEPTLDRFFALSREPAELVELDPYRAKLGRRVKLSFDSWADTGHAIFHSTSGGGGTACASCHPEGRDDGHSWKSQLLGARRTPSLIGTVQGTAPYHWNGEAAGLPDVMDMTFTQRMKGPALTESQKEAISTWLGELPPLRRASMAVSSVTTTARGRAIFESATARCSSCHSGSMLTNNATVDVGTGGKMQVPSLVGVVHRAPYLHDGSRPNLRTVLYDPHGGGAVRADEIDDLALYLESL